MAVSAGTVKRLEPERGGVSVVDSGALPHRKAPRIVRRIRAILNTIPDLARWLGAAGWMALIFRISALSGGEVPGGLGGASGHFIGYAALGVLLAFALISRFDGPRALALAVLIGSVYGLTDEFHQSFVPGRTPDIADWGVDTLGALVGAWVLVWLMRAR